MNTIWSDYIQKVGTLYSSRQLRFSDLFKNQYLNAFQIHNQSRMLEIGCGPGALCQALHRWYPQAEIIGIDRDSNFIDFARREAPDVTFSEEDATALSFANNSFDVTISNTVVEHIEPSKFFSEQYRVLSSGGVCLVLSARRGVSIPAPCISELSSLEKEIFARTQPYFNEIDKKYSVAAYAQSEADLPNNMETFGFKQVSTTYVTVNLTPDNPNFSCEMAHAMINANRQCDLDAVDALPMIAPNVVTTEELLELKRIKNAKYNKRIELYDAGIKQWDTNVSVTMIVRGVKE